MLSHGKCYGIREFVASTLDKVVEVVVGVDVRVEILWLAGSHGTCHLVCRSRCRALLHCCWALGGFVIDGDVVCLVGFDAVHQSCAWSIDAREYAAQQA